MSIHPTAFIHPLADVEDGVIIGKDCKIWRWTHIMSGAVIGDSTMIGQSCSIAGNVKIGNNVRVQNGCHLFDGVVIEDFSFIGPGVIFTNVKFPRSHRKGKYEQTLLQEHCTIGANSTIICGITIGPWAMIGAGSVVTKSVGAGLTSFGNPAQIKKNNLDRGQK